MIQDSGGDSLSEVGHNITLNLLPCGLAFTAAITWALYGNLTRRFSPGSVCIPSLPFWQ